jgi:hypothetical protein
MSYSPNTDKQNKIDASFLLGIGAAVAIALTATPDIAPWGIAVLVPAGIISLTFGVSKLNLWNTLKTSGKISMIVFIILIMCGLGWIIWPKSEAFTPSFKVTIQTGILDLDLSNPPADDQVGSFWASYNYFSTSSRYAVSPISILLFADITNLTTSTQTIASYSTSLTIPGCGTVTLTAIPTTGVNLWMAAPDLQAAAPMTLSSDLYSLLQNPIPSGETITGGLLFSYPSQCYQTETTPDTYDFHFNTYSGISYDAITTEQNSTSTSDTTTRNLGLDLKKPTVDISNFLKRMYSPQ